MNANSIPERNVNIEKVICLHCLGEITEDNTGQVFNGDSICLECVTKANRNYREIMEKLKTRSRETN